jgi:transcriptional regulator with XRE-family HTH domain
MDTVGERIKTARKAKGYTQKALAEILSISGNYVYLLEAGKENASGRMLRDIANALYVNENWLITGHGDMETPKTAAEEAAEYVEELLGPDDNPLYDLIRATMKIYIELGAKEQQIIKDFAQSLVNEAKKKGGD